MNESAQFKVGDVIDFPLHAESKGTLHGYSVSWSQGLPGKWRVTAVDPDGSIQVERVVDEELRPRRLKRHSNRARKGCRG